LADSRVRPANAPIVIKSIGLLQDRATCPVPRASGLTQGKGQAASGRASADLAT